MSAGLMPEKRTWMRTWPDVGVYVSSIVLRLSWLSASIQMAVLGAVGGMMMRQLLLVACHE